LAAQAVCHSTAAAFQQSLVRYRLNDYSVPTTFLREFGATVIWDLWAFERSKRGAFPVAPIDFRG
jgi:hypothetical protein